MRSASTELRCQPASVRRISPRSSASLQHLLEHERVALRARADEARELGVDLVGVEDRRDHLGQVRRGHRRDRDRLGEARPPPDLNRARQRVAAIELVAPVGGEKHHPALREPPGRVVEELACRAVGPVDVVEDEEQAAVRAPRARGASRPTRRGAAWPARGRPPAPSAARPRAAGRAGRAPLPWARARRGARPDPARPGGCRPPRRTAGREARARPPSSCPRGRRSPACAPGCVSSVGEPRLADSRLPGQQDEASVAAIRGEQRVLELRQLLLPPDENGGENPLEHPGILPGPR